MKDLLRTEHLSREDVELILDTAAQFASKPFRSKDALANQTVAIYMTKSSTRTRLASETAVAHLGGTPIFLRGDDLQIGRGETISDTAKIISGFASALIVRTFAQSDDGNNMAHAWLTMGAIMGAHVVVATPDGKWAQAKDAIQSAKSIASKTGAKIEVLTDPEAAAKDASVLYTDVWMSMGDPEEVRTEKLKALAPFAITKNLMSLTASDSIFMHCLPAHRGEEVAAEVIDGPKSVIWREAFHRRTTIQAVLYHLVRGELTGN